MGRPKKPRQASMIDDAIDMATVPSGEKWMHTNPEVAASIKIGMEQSRNGESVERSFAEFANDSLSEELIDSATHPSPSANANWDFYCRTDYLRTIAQLIESLGPITDPNIAKERLDLLRAAMAKAKEML